MLAPKWLDQTVDRSTVRDSLCITLALGVLLILLYFTPSVLHPYIFGWSFIAPFIVSGSRGWVFRFLCGPLLWIFMGIVIISYRLLPKQTSINGSVSQTKYKVPIVNIEF